MTTSLNRGEDSAIGLQGGDVKTLTTNVPDPNPHFEVNLQSISSHFGMSKSILTGNITGERASTEDSQAFNEFCQSRRTNELNFDIELFLTKLRDLGIFSRKRYEIVWDDLAETTPSEKLQRANMMSDINQKMMMLSGEVFDINEIREAAGFERLDELEQEPLADVDPDATHNEIDNDEG